MSFSLNRFCKFIKTDIIENKVMYLSVLVGSFAVMILIAVLFSQLHWMSDNAIKLKTTFNVFSLFITILTICLAFWDIPSKGKFINLVQKPASMLEKFLARILIFVFIFPSIQKLFFIFVEFCRTLFLPRFEGDWFMSIYGRLEDEGFFQYFMNVDQAMFAGCIVGWSVISLVIYFSATFGGLKSFLHFTASFFFGLIFFTGFMIYKSSIDSSMSSVNVVADRESVVIMTALILASGAIFAATSLSVKTLLSRSVSPKLAIFRGWMSYIGMILYLVVSMFVYDVILDYLRAKEFGVSSTIMLAMSSFNIIWLLYGSYRNFAQRQLSNCIN